MNLYMTPIKTLENNLTSTEDILTYFGIDPENYREPYIKQTIKQFKTLYKKYGSNYEYSFEGDVWRWNGEIIETLGYVSVFIPRC